MGGKEAEEEGVDERGGKKRSRDVVAKDGDGLVVDELGEVVDGSGDGGGRGITGGEGGGGER